MYVCMYVNDVKTNYNSDVVIRYIIHRAGIARSRVQTPLKS